MIIAIVSRYEQAGKSGAMRNIVLSNMSDYYGFSFAGNINAAAGLFVKLHTRTGVVSKYEKHPVLGVRLKDVNHIISDALTKKHPELPVFLVKEEIEDTIKAGHHIVIDDMRREREFIWAREVAEKYGTGFHLIEVIPVSKQLERAQLDTWTNNIEPCGYHAWADITRPIVYNDGTEKFYDDVLRLVNELQEQESA